MPYFPLGARFESGRRLRSISALPSAGARERRRVTAAPPNELPRREEPCGDGGDATAEVGGAGDQVLQALLAVVDHKRVRAVRDREVGVDEDACRVARPEDSPTVGQCPRAGFDPKSARAPEHDRLLQIGTAGIGLKGSWQAHA